MDGKGTEKRPYKDKGDDFSDFLAIYFTCTPLLMVLASLFVANGCT